MRLSELQRIWRGIDGPKPCVDIDCCRRPDCRASARSWLVHSNERGFDFRGVDLEREIEVEEEPNLSSLAEAAPRLRGDEVIWVSAVVTYGQGRGEIVDGSLIDLATGRAVA